MLTQDLDNSSTERAIDQADLTIARWRTGDVRSTRNFAGGLHANLMANPAGEAAGPPSDASIIIQVVRGERQHRQWQGGRVCINGPLPDGGLVIVPAGLAPRAVVSREIRVLHVYAPTAVLSKMHHEEGGAGTVELIDPRLAGDPLLAGAMAQLAHGLASGNSPRRLWLDGIGQAICACALERWSNVAGTRRSTPVRAGASDWRLRRAIEFMQAGLGDDLSLNEIAAAVGVTATHLTTLFRAGTGETPYRWLMRRRVVRASELLTDPRRSVTEVAFACGFASSQHLATAFRKRLGMSPSAWRRERLL